MFIFRNAHQISLLVKHVFANWNLVTWFMNSSRGSFSPSNIPSDFNALISATSSGETCWLLLSLDNTLSFSFGRLFIFCSDFSLNNLKWSDNRGKEKLLLNSPKYYYIIISNLTCSVKSLCSCFEILGNYEYALLTIFSLSPLSLYSIKIAQ